MISSSFQEQCDKMILILPLKYLNMKGNEYSKSPIFPKIRRTFKNSYI